MECPNPKCRDVNVTSCGLNTGQKWKCLTCGTVFNRDRPKEGFVVGRPPGTAQNVREWM